MRALRLGSRKGRVLLVGRRAACVDLDRRLAQVGFDTATAESPRSLLRVAARLEPEAILFAGCSDQEAEALQIIRRDARLRELPTLAHVPGGELESFRRLHLDDLVHSVEELTLRVESALRARRLVEQDARLQRRMETLLEITQAAASSLQLEHMLRLSVERAARVISVDRISVVLVETDGPLTARVVASHDDPGFAAMELDLVRYPEIRHALQTRQPVHVVDAEHDPLLEEVRREALGAGLRSVFIQPMVCGEDLLGALVLRNSESEVVLDREEREFAQAVAAALANSLRNAKLHQSLQRKREELESAYIDRYRELNEANRRLKEINRLKDDIIAVCSHDLRAPLNVLLGHGQLLLDGELAPQQILSAEAIVRQGKKILSLVESLLEKGRGDAERLSLDARLLDVAELCQESASELEILAAGRGISIRAEAPESLMAIGDEIKIHEVLQNLITNAIHHAREAGEVVVRAQRLRRPDGEVARVSVQDNGAGVPAEELHLVFDKYRHGPGGHGLGLSICKEFVELHGGEIWAEAPRVGGASFVFTLPLAKEHSPALSKPPPVLLGEQPRVLVVEDEPEIAAVLTEILRTRYRVELARDGAEGLAKARALHPDLLVMDVFLPRMDGLDAAVALKSSSDTADIPVILVSAHQGVAEKVRALNLGAVDYMGKPFQTMELLNRAERALKLARTERELQRSVHLLKRSGSDPETGLLDKTGLDTRLEPEVARCRRYGRALALVVLRPRGPVGEKVRACATVVRQRLRTPDVVAHLGGGLFVAMMPECTGEQAQLALMRLTVELERESGVPFRCQALDVGDGDTTSASLLDRLLHSTQPETR